jgi:hypothetical protein
MSILNQVDLLDAIATRTPDNTTEEVSPADIRQDFTDIIDSLQSYAGVMEGGVVASIDVTETATVFPAMLTINATPTATALLEADQANDQIKVFENGRYQMTLRFQGTWSAQRELEFHVHVNGIENVLTPIIFTQEGNASAQTISVTSVTFLINDTMIAAGPGYASVQLALGIDTAASVSQTKTTFGLSYGPLSIDTIPG